MDPLPVLEEQFQLHSSPKDESESVNQVTPLNPSLDQECEAMETASDVSPVEPEVLVPHCNFLPMLPAFFPTYFPVPFPFWPPNSPPSGEERGDKHQVLKPTPVLTKDPIQVDELLGLSKLSIGEGVAGRMEPSALSVKLLGASSRQSAFHANPTVGGSDLSPRKSNAIHAL